MPRPFHYTAANREGKRKFVLFQHGEGGLSACLDRRVDEGFSRYHIAGKDAATFKRAEKCLSSLCSVRVVVIAAEFCSDLLGRELMKPLLCLEIELNTMHTNFSAGY